MKSIENQYEKIKGWFKEDVLKEESVFEFLQNVGKAKCERHVRETLGHYKGFENNIRLQIYDLLRAIALSEQNNQKFNILWIENNPEKPLVDIDERFKEVLKNGSQSLKLNDALIEVFNLIPDSHVYIYQKDFQKLYKKLIKSKQKMKKDILIDCKLLKKGESRENIRIALDSIDFILVDIVLEEDSGKRIKIDGIDFTNVFREVCPGTPVFIFSVINDYDTIQRAYSKGADLYVTKNQVFSVPFLYYAYINQLGELIHFVKNKKLKRSLLGNIRYWKYKRNYLWFGDKCYHMINHSFNHIQDDWEIANKILVPLLRTGFLEKQGKRDELLYSFCMAIWLHDIGHKGNHRYGEPHLIRDTHGVISGEITLSLPESFGIKRDNTRNYIYENLLFPVGKEEKPVTQLILEEVKQNKRLSIPEMIALFSIYHKSNCPLRDLEYYGMVRNGKFIPNDFFEKSEQGNPVITLEKILDELKNDELKNDEFKQDFLTLMALFRLIDGLDIKVTRVGDPNEEDMKKWVIKRDLEYNFSKMKDLVERMAIRFSNNPLQQASFIKSYFLDIKEKIERKESISINELAKLLSRFKEWEEYRMLLSYCYFIGAQEGHFDLHSSVSKIDIEYEGGRCFKITLWTEKEEKELKEKKVYEVGKETETIFERLIDKNKCYILNELNSGKEDLKKVLEKVIIELKNLYRDERYGEPVSWPMEKES